MGFQMKLSLKYIAIAALVVFILTALVPYVIDRPEDIYKISSHERSIRTSGLPPKGRLLLNTSAFVIFVCALALFFYAQKLDKSPACENDVLRLRRYCRIYQYLLITAGVINIAQITLAVSGLLTIQHISYAHVFHSRLFGYLGCLLVCMWFFLGTYKYIKTLQTIPPSVLLAARRRVDFLPRKLTKEEIALATANWVRVLYRYSYYKRRALWEKNPGFYTLLASVIAAIAKKDRHLIDIATELTKENVPRYVYLYLVSSALRCFGEKEEGLKMIRDAVKLNQSPSTLLSLAADIDDLEEKENLAKEVLNENPKDTEALWQLAYAKYFKEESEEAERLIDKILFNDPDNIFAREFKGNIYFDKEDYQKALEQYLRVKIKPT